jgi:protein involved in polysaccharide export with SLBB domain
MVRPCAFFAFALTLAMLAGVPVCAQTAGSAPQSLSPGQPRYSSQVPPGVDDARFQPPSPSPSPSPDAPPATPDAPAAAPTTPVDVSSEPSQSDQNDIAQRLRYSSQVEPSENITVTALRQSEDSTYRLGTGDKLRVTVFNETDLSGDFDVDGMGFVRLPLIGQIQAQGLSAYQLEERIAASYSDGRFLINPRVNVEVTTYRPFYIIGQVAKPGEYPYVNAMTAPNAIALAGGYTDEAAQATLYVRHEGDTKEVEVPADATTRIAPGDVVRVARTGYWNVMTYLSPLLSPFSSVIYLLK